ncbi:aminoglycoside phosphotransferase family protein [Streptomyces alkaliterrae]|uniref:Phosphotransferase n=1 Tax=Streptomyces alkaliterrae TaxID=2213162 RepID=A0A5P0YZH2_9ACTN|nr:aminoglycoside phosphotransferase family protein [Streptomyces alkaliterrae]MQS05027.1 phosphotransferase [Streptomyces alkaliterrae]
MSHRTPAPADATPPIDGDLAARLVAGQFPRWAGLPLAPVDPAGSDHVIFRLGDDMAVRLPRGDWAAGQAPKEHRWLPGLTPALPLAVPEPIALGEPDLGYPWPWSVARWLDGAPATVAGLGDSAADAVRLADFLNSLRRLPPPSGGPHAELVGGTLAARDAATRAGIKAVAGTFDARALTELWDDALAAPAWRGTPVWFHGDMHTGNLLTRRGRLSAVIDFGSLGVGDPACDLVVAWTLMSRRSRDAFRDALGLDDATWLRGMGWALTTGLNAYTAYAATNPRVAEQTRRQITEAVADHRALARVSRGPGGRA